MRLSKREQLQKKNALRNKIQHNKCTILLILGNFIEVKKQ